MYKYEIELLAPAWRELEEIADMHLALVGTKSTKKITDKILDDIDRLSITPYLGKACEEPILAADNFRRLVSGNYLCFYRIIGKKVYIYHIVNGKRDYPKLFGTE
jgi:plasmid stabilization system protein ParE